MPAAAPRTNVSHARVRAFDGVRGIAILGVLFVHSREPLAHAGYLGVDVFFALSGFLITSILLRESARSGRIRLRAFYARRVLRLYPALLAFCVVMVLIPRTMGFTGIPGALPAVGLSAGYLVDVAVWLRWPVAIGGANALWTLGVEEMFYLIWPAVLVLLLRSRRPAHYVPIVLGAGIAYAYGALVSGSGPHVGHLGVPIPVYFRPDARAASILIGCLSAWILHRRRTPAGPLPAVLSWVGAAGLAGLLLDGPDASSSWAYRAAMPLTAICTGLILLGISWHGGGTIAKVLSWRPLAWVGVISYGLYLADPIAVQIIDRHTSLTRSDGVVPILLITFALAAASYRWLETPVLRLKDRMRSSGSLDAEPVVASAATAHPAHPAR